MVQATPLEEHWIGIDLGTTNSCAAIFKKGDLIDMIQISDGGNTIPSYVTYKKKKNEILVGAPAKNAIIQELDNTVYDAKRLLGRQFEDSKIQQDIKNWNFKIIPGRLNKPKYMITQCNRDQTYQPEQVSAKILEKIKQSAEIQLQ